MAEEKIYPYIGITDFTDRSQVEAMSAVLKNTSGDRLIRNLGVGIMMSCKTLNDLPSKFSQVFPAKERIADVFTNDPYVYNILHYADYEGIDVLENLTAAAKWSGPNLDAIQLDMIWPDPIAIKKFRDLHPHIQLILQINPSALQKVDHRLPGLVGRLKKYGSALNGVLLDMSMGRGVPMQWSNLLVYILYINNLLPDMSFVVAGGLGPNSLNLVEPLINCLPLEISIDAQGKLRPSGNLMDPIDWQMAKEYVVRSLGMIQSKQQGK